MRAIAWLFVVGASAFDVRVDRPSSKRWARTRCGGPTGTADLPTAWARDVSAFTAPLPEYPRPMMVRSSVGAPVDRDHGDPAVWASLNGLWEWEADHAPAGSPPPFGRTLSGAILVPFPVESCLSGVAPNSSKTAVRRMWYRLQVMYQYFHPSIYTVVLLRARVFFGPPPRLLESDGNGAPPGRLRAATVSRSGNPITKRI